MNTKSAILAIWFLATTATFSAAKSVEVPHTPLISRGEGPLFVVDYAVFQGVDQRPYIEFYLQVPYEQLQFIKDDEQFRADYRLALRLYDESNSMVEQQSIVDSLVVDTFAETVCPSKARVSQMAFTIDAGVHRMEAEVIDVETRASSTLAEDLLLPGFETTSLLISDLQFSPNIRLAAAGEPYVKNSRFIEPNPSKMFTSERDKRIYVYFEVYNLGSVGETYTTIYTFQDNQGNQVAQLKRENVKPGPTSACSLGFPAEHFKPGDYVLKVETYDNDGASAAANTARFTVLEPALELSQQTH